MSCDSGQRWYRCSYHVFRSDFEFDFAIFLSSFLSKHRNPALLLGVHRYIVCQTPDTALDRFNASPISKIMSLVPRLLIDQMPVHRHRKADVQGQTKSPGRHVPCLVE